MPIRDSTPTYFAYTGLSDAVDEVSAFKGASQSISNFVFDRISRGAVVPRPGVQALTTPTSNTQYTGQGVVSAAFIVGNLIYGMIAQTTYAGKDAPFVYNITTGTFATISNVSSGLLPNTQSATGDWTPPTIDMIGQYVVVTHPGFTGGANPYFGWFDLTTPGTTKWNAGNTATNALPFIPTTVRQFFGRAYYFGGNKGQMSDILNPLNVTNTEAADVLSFGDSTSITAACGLPIGTAISGVLQALIVFKAKSVWQITGDISLNTLAINELTGSLGCSAPNSVVVVPTGVAFMATDGVRQVNLLGQVPFYNSDIIGPFSYAETVTRACAAYGNTTYRLSVSTDFKQSTFVTNEYWYDERVGRWNGPHTFPFSILVSDGQTFYGFSNANPAILFKSDVVNGPTSIFQDNGANFNCQGTSCALEEPREDMVKQAVESTIELSQGTASATYTITAQDDLGNTITTASINVSNGSGAWGTAIWGAFDWEAAIFTSHVNTIPWPIPVVYKKLVVQTTVQAAQSVSIKRIMSRSQATNYTNLP